MAITQKKITNAGEDVKKRRSYALLVGKLDGGFSNN
jgi:hypothetical protein